ncbi:tyrosinase family oxidase copper chaperone [Streptomyces sp. NPDC048362]|uniref:apotyrosinase chaperone MelC1 n=1 Tax=Streptomyces sp. NPDC048362 TaxID=3365539 RepID=UPI003724A898
MPSLSSVGTRSAANMRWRGAKPHRPKKPFCGKSACLVAEDRRQELRMHRLTRRTAIRGSTLALAAAVLGRPVSASAQQRVATHVDDGAPRPSGAVSGGRGGHTHPEAFDETYLGRRIQGWPSAEHGAIRHGHLMHDAPMAMGFMVRIDNDDLHVMQNRDGTWLSVINHYEKQDTPREVARAAVRDLHGASLVPLMA